LQKTNGTTKEKGGDYEEYLLNKLHQVQNEEDGLNLYENKKSKEVFGVRRSFFRWGSTTAGTNAPNGDECTDEDIIWNNQWRKEEMVGTKMASLDMLQLYTSIQYNL
jgi:hypothetical protein